MSFPRIVVDTNLLVAHVFRPQAEGPRVLLERWRGGALRVCISPDVLSEMHATLRRLPRVVAERREDIFELLESPRATDLIEHVEDSGFRCADPSDDKFLHLAIAASAEALVTSDRALLEMIDFPVPIVTSGQWNRSMGR